MKQVERSKGRDNNLLFKEIKADSLRSEDREIKQTNKQTKVFCSSGLTQRF